MKDNPVHHATYSASPTAGVATQVPPGGAAGGVEFPSERLTDRRKGPRRPLALDACLISTFGANVIPCVSEDVGEGGMYLTVPVGYGLAVGQRYELVLGTSREAADFDGWPYGEGHLATVVRAELRMNGSEGRVAIGVKFDKPFVL